MIVDTPRGKRSLNLRLQGDRTTRPQLLHELQRAVNRPAAGTIAYFPFTMRAYFSTALSGTSNRQPSDERLISNLSSFVLP